jgi:hypothetical protein
MIEAAKKAIGVNDAVVNSSIAQVRPKTTAALVPAPWAVIGIQSKSIGLKFRD